MSKWLAIVGSQHFAEGSAHVLAGQIIRQELEVYQPDGCVSGGARGIDTLFQRIAESYGYRVQDGNFIVYLPAHPRWEPNGYKARNILVAEKATRLVAIRCHAAKTYGSGWTADYAEKIGRDVRREIL